MTIRQTIFLLIFFVFVVFQFSLLIVRNTSTILNAAQVEAFFLVIIISLLSMVFLNKDGLAQNTTIAASTAAGLGIYFFARQFFTNSGMDWLVLMALITGAGISVLARQAAARASRAESGQ